MKKLTLIIAALMAAATLTGCGGGDTSTASDSSVSDAAQVKSISDKTAEVIAKVDMPDMAEVTPDKLTIYYKFNEEDVTEYSAYVAGAGAYCRRQDHAGGVLCGLRYSHRNGSPGIQCAR